MFAQSLLNKDYAYLCGDVSAYALIYDFIIVL